MKALIGLLLFSNIAGAQQIWDYTSAPMAQTIQMGDAPEIPNVTGEIDLVQALNPNQTNQIVTPTYFNFGGILNSQQLQILQGTNPAPTFSFSTVNGQITAWSVNINMTPAPGTEAVWTESFVSTAQGDTLNEYESAVCYGGFGPPNQSCFQTSAVSSVAGTWVDPPAKAPEMDGKIGVGAITLLAGAMLVWLERKRS